MGHGDALADGRAAQAFPVKERGQKTPGVMQGLALNHQSHDFFKGVVLVFGFQVQENQIFVEIVYKPHDRMIIIQIPAFVKAARF